jgi:hypothetical protein
MQSFAGSAELHMRLRSNEQLRWGLAHPAIFPHQPLSALPLVRRPVEAMRTVNLVAPLETASERSELQDVQVL